MNKMVETKIGNNIRKIREAKGMTQEMLAAKLQLNGCDITRSAIAAVDPPVITPASELPVEAEPVLELVLAVTLP